MDTASFSHSHSKYSLVMIHMCHEISPHKFHIHSFKFHLQFACSCNTMAVVQCADHLAWLAAFYMEMAMLFGSSQNGTNAGGFITRFGVLALSQLAHHLRCVIPTSLFEWYDALVESCMPMSFCVITTPDLICWGQVHSIYILHSKINL